MKSKKVHRRDFMKAAAIVGAGLTVLPSGRILGQNAPSNKLNIAMIGTWGRADAHFGSVASENIVALCDVNEDHLAHGAEKFPKAKTYVDWRKCIEQKDVDAVVICTPDHHHAMMSMWAMNRGMHVYCEKPLANCVSDARMVRETFLKNKNKIATQCGTQRHAKPNFNRVRELIRDGVIGELKHAYAWGNRQLRRDGYPKGDGTPPKNIHWDLWLGPAHNHPYSPEYFKLGPGMNCLSWNMYWDFGSGQVGDMGSHTMDLVWNAVDAKLPTSATGEGDKFNPEVTPVELKTTFEHPANDWRGPIGVSWYQGGAMPQSPRGYVDLNRIGHGAMFKGTKGFVVADFDSRLVIPFGDDADLGYYNRRDKKEMIPNLGHFQREWIDACKGDLKTSCDFEYSGDLIEQMLLGLVAYRVGKKLNYDGKTGRVTNSDEANALLQYKYRDGWVLNG